ncbi:hypothetical protein AB1Y20_016744 [Prymnesium parvum]|uniref:Receptor ligand binding region domain-containing protein n=1 Tax=Prymnesium parvum TaxID=97485 RepID=A0AB34IAY2_PRYPA
MTSWRALGAHSKKYAFIAATVLLLTAGCNGEHLSKAVERGQRRLQDQPRTIRLGLLLPMFGTEASGFSRFSWSPRAGVYQALREINNKTDGVEDHLLPNTQLLYAYRDSKCDSSVALQGALHLTQDVFGGAGVDVIIGAGCSDASVTAAQVAASVGVPMISPTSTSPVLSRGRAYPYFIRTAPSDSFTAEAMVVALTQLWNFSSVALVHSSDAYGTGMADVFLAAASARSLTVRTRQTFIKDAAHFSLQHRGLIEAESRIIVIVCPTSDGSRFIRTAFEAGIGGEGYLWLSGDTMAESGLWESDAVLATDLSLRERLLRGFFTLSANGQPDGTAKYDSYLARRQQLPSTTGDGVTCNLETDDDGTLLWAQDHDANASTPLACDGYDASTINLYDPKHSASTRCSQSPMLCTT